MGGVVGAVSSFQLSADVSGFRFFLRRESFGEEEIAANR